MTGTAHLPQMTISSIPISVAEAAMSPSPDLKSHLCNLWWRTTGPSWMGLSNGSSIRACCLMPRKNGGAIRGARATPHEGLDLYSFAEVDGMMKTVDQHTKIPAAFAGEIVKIDRDFLGKSIYISHAIFDGRRPAALFGVTATPSPGSLCKSAHYVAAGEIIAAISGLPGKKPRSRPICTSPSPGCRCRLPRISLTGKTWAIIPGSR